MMRCVLAYEVFHSRVQFRIVLVVRELILGILCVYRAGQVTRRGRRARSSRAKNRTPRLTYGRKVKAIVCPRAGSESLGVLDLGHLERGCCHLSLVREIVVHFYYKARGQKRCTEK